jgi:hypothetical protein
MNLKVLTFLLLIGSFTSPVLAQKIRGAIISIDSIPIENANILIKHFGVENEIIQYTFSDSKGKYSIDLDRDLDSLIIEVNSMSFEPKRLMLKNLKSKTSPITVNIKLYNRVTELKEVLLDPVKRPIRVKKDTIVYDPNKFKDGTEKVVEDLLRKLPGIEIEDNGIIKFKGQPISKLLIEGDDLFGLNYNIGSKNIDSEIVGEVEAIENYVENPLLKNIKSSNDVAINLKLKKGQADFSGNGSLGYGYKDRYNIRGTLLGITKKIKGFSTLQYNNIGRNYTPYDFTSKRLSIESQSEQEQTSKKNIEEGIFKENKNYSNSKINNAFYTSLNSIFNISQKTSLKLGLGYYKDRLSQITNNSTTYNTSAGNLEVSNTSNLLKKPSLLNLKTYIKYNPSDRLRIEFNSKFSYQDNSTLNNAFNNSTNVKSDNTTQSLFTKHSLLITKKKSDNNALQFKSLFSFSNTPQEYFIEPGFDFNNGTLDNNIINRQESTFTKLYLDSYFKWFNVNSIGKFEMDSGFNIVKDELESVLSQKNGADSFSQLGNSFLNEYDYNTKRLYLNSSFTYSIKNWSFKPSININYYSGKFEDNIRDTDAELKSLYINPKLRVGYKTGQFSGLFTSYVYKRTPPLETYLFSGNILTSFRSVRNNVFDLEFLDTHSFILGFMNNDFYNLFRTNITFAYNLTENRYTANTTINEDIIYSSAFLLSRSTKNYNLNFNISKYVNFLKTTFALNSNYSINIFNNVVNNSELRLNRGENLINSLFFKTGFKRKLNFENRFNLHNNSYFSNGNLSSYASFFEERFKLIYKQSDKLIFTVSNNYTSATQSSREYYFLDTELIYTPSKTTTYSLIGRNLTNNNRIETFAISDFSQSVESYNLLGFYLLMGVDFRF